MINQPFKLMIINSCFRLTVDCLKNFIKCTQSYDLLEFYNSEDVWTLLGDEIKNAEGCFILAKYVHIF